MSQMTLDDFLKSEPVVPKEETKKTSPTKDSIQEYTPAVPDQSEDEVADEPQEEQQKIFSVSDLNSAIKNQLEGDFPLIWLQGEISNFKPHTSGHFYFTLKDSKAQINAVMFKGFNRHIKFKPADGMEILVRGKVTVYEPRGTYQIFCEVMEPVGLGALQIAYEQLKKKLQAEGLFDKAKKRPIPKLPAKVAIITSPTGAAIRDMLNVLGRRMKSLDITIFPCAVQGNLAVREIVSAIELANKMGNFDVMIVGRGGGSIEDLWSFNEEPVVRAIANSKIPTVSAVGHEIDFTIADFVADLRAPTPSAAAELISQNAADMVDKLQAQFKSLRLVMFKTLQSEQQKVQFLSRKLIDPRRKLQDLSIRCDELEERLSTSMQSLIERKKLNLLAMQSRMKNPIQSIELLNRRVEQISKTLMYSVQKLISKKREVFLRNTSALDSMSPLKVLDRGYSIVKSGSKVLKTAKDANVGSSLEIILHQGKLNAKITEIKE